MTRRRLMQSVSFIGGTPDGGIIDLAMRALANAAPTATVATIIAPDGSARYISRAEAERHVAGAPRDGEVKQ